MLKKEEWVVLVVFLLFASLFIYFNPEGSEGITGLAVGDDVSFDVVLTKTSFASGDEVGGYLNLTFTGPIDPSTEIKVEFNSLTRELVLKDYFNKKNISFEETESSVAASNYEDSKDFSFGAAGSKEFAFKLPKLATVKDLNMKITGSNEPSFVSFDVDDYTGKKEWRYFGDFNNFNTDHVYPSSLDITSVGNPIMLGGAVDNNKTYFCEAINLPESKDFNLSAKFKKIHESNDTDIKMVLLSFDGDSASGGADSCDLPEPSFGAASEWDSCELSFSTSKQGLYLVCVYYIGDTENNYYELSRDGTASDSRFDCKRNGPTIPFPCSGGSKDYFIRVQTANYTRVLGGWVSWSKGVTDQEMKYSLTQFLQDCEEDEIGDCIIPVTVSSETAGGVQVSNLRIDYTEAGGAASYSDKFCDIAGVPGKIVKLDGVDLNTSSKTIQIPFSEFNLTVPSITEVAKIFYLKMELVPGGKVTKPVKVYGTGYVPETGDVEEKISEAKKAISDMEAEHGDELDLFGIELDVTQLDSYESEVNNLKADTNLSVEEVNVQLDSLLGQVETYLRTQPKSFGIDIGFRDLYIPEPGDVEEVVLENFDEVYLYQKNIEVSVDVANYILKKYNGDTQKYSVITKTVIPKKTLSNVYIYEIIPKTLANNVADVIFKNKDYEVVEQDPIIRYVFSSLSKSTTITYGVKDVTIPQGMFAGLNSIIVPQKVEEVLEKTHECGDGVCTRPYEDEDVCPEDCGGRRPIPWVLIIILVVLLIAGVVYINFYKGKGEFRKLAGRSPFSNPKELESIKNYIKVAQDKGIKKQDVARALLKTGWTKDKVIYAFEDSKWDEKRLFTIKFAPGGKENIKKLKTFVKKCLQLNMPEVKIRNILMQKGWSVDKINDAFASVGKPKEKVVTEKEKKKKVSFYFEKALEKEAKK